MSQPTPLPQPQPIPQIGPQPLPTQITVGQARGPDGRAFVLLQFTTPAGIGFYFLDGDAALQVAGQIRHFGRASKSGLTIPAGVHLNGDADEGT